MTNTSLIPSYAPVIIKLLQGVVYNDNRELWNMLIDHQVPIKEYFGMIGIDVHIYESDGFAFLKQRQFEEGREENLPRLIEKRQLGYYVTLLCVLLVEKLIEFDVAGGDSTRLIVDREEIKEMVRVFLPEKSNDARIMDSMDAHINKLEDYGFLRKLNTAEDKYEVKRILKAKVPADTLLEIKKRLEAYADTLT
jgi:hypothetical protein